MLFVFLSKSDICTTWLDSASPITKSFAVETAGTASATRQTTWRRGFTDQHRRLVDILVRDNASSVKTFGNRRNSHRSAFRMPFQVSTCALKRCEFFECVANDCILFTDKATASRRKIAWGNARRAECFGKFSTNFVNQYCLEPVLISQCYT